MLSVKYIEENKDDVINRLAKKGFDAIDIVEKLLNADNLRKQLQAKTDNIQADLNVKAAKIGALYKEGQKEQAESLKQDVSSIKENATKLIKQQEQAEQDVKSFLVQLPNVPHKSVPDGRTAAENVVVRTGGIFPKLPENALPHWELTKKFNLIDFELGAKITGAGFPVYKEKGARLQRALISFFLDCAGNAGYKEILPPLVVSEDSAFATGQLPDKEVQMYHIGADNLFLIPTAEVPVTNIYRNVILEAADMPIKMAAYTPCFRREAGSYGKEVRGLNRLHQFDKVEIVRIEQPEHSYQALDEMVEYVENLLQKLELPYRIVKLCGGDMSFTAALTYDFEVFSAAQKIWLEVSSVSNFETFQANRLKLRYRSELSKKPLPVHTLNGSALALPRIVAALLENGQHSNKIILPATLHQYTGFDTIY